MNQYLSACADTSGTPRLAALRKTQRKHRMGNATAARAFIEAGTLVAEVLEEGSDSIVLVDVAWKVKPEATPRDAHRRFG
jgi:hypothetical protein